MTTETMAAAIMTETEETTIITVIILTEITAITIITAIIITEIAIIITAITMAAITNRTIMQRIVPVQYLLHSRRRKKKSR